MSATAWVYRAQFQCRRCGGHFRGIRAVTEENARSVGQQFDLPRVKERRELCLKKGHKPGEIEEIVEEVK